MIHYYYIGSFDPRMPIDLSQKPAPPKSTRPIPGDLVDQLATKFGISLREQVVTIDGYLLSHLGYFGQLHRFESELVKHGCVVLTETGLVVQPPKAVRVYCEALESWIKPER
jgi:hypothetical protein